MSNSVEAQTVNIIFALREIRVLLNRLMQWVDPEDFGYSDIPHVRRLVAEISERLGRTTEWTRLAQLYEIDALADSFSD